MWVGASAVLLGYLLGSISGSLLLGRLHGVDIRRHGSGNAGGTNALRTLGWPTATGVVLIDIGKGTLACLVAFWLLDNAATPAPHAPEPWTGLGAYLAGLAAIAGHIWPLWHGFRGGKGGATMIGVVVAVAPWALIPQLLTWLLVLVVSGYVSLATCAAGLVLLPAMAWLPGPGSPWSRLAVAAAIASLVCYAHRDNLRRLMAGTERRFEAVRFWRR